MIQCSRHGECPSQLVLEENERQCTRFDEDMKWQLKSKLVKPAMTAQLPVEGERAGHKIFHASRFGG